MIENPYWVNFENLSASQLAGYEAMGKELKSTELEVLTMVAVTIIGAGIALTTKNDTLELGAWVLGFGSAFIAAARGHVVETLNNYQDFVREEAISRRQERQ